MLTFEKTKPSCMRCCEKGFKCEYSPARRIGRVRSKTVKSISDDVKYRLPRGDVHSACSPPPDMTDEMESPPDLSPPPPLQRTPDWNNSWTLSEGGDFGITSTQQQQQHWIKPDPFSPSQQQQNNFLATAQAFLPSSMDSQTLVSATCRLPQLVSEQGFAPMSTTTDSPFGPNAISALTAPEPPPARVPTMHRSSTSSTPGEASTSDGKHIDEEFAGLITFADSIESKFDVFVRTRLSLHEAEGSGPDPGEMSFYYSLSELKRRLKWLREDVRNS
ncbi:Hypothetical predicted protein [Lecanosticta acicola]|uniref:Zn(2)-C6 fungal-type domain-containing protein n=1 Tax=Lecanosticta acicola TaxID=111012 RepID=A0AAI8Z633_9PEZI|nr:Hypothetical predicted protein [Lecanosticta acicola]